MWRVFGSSSQLRLLQFKEIRGVATPRRQIRNILSLFINPIFCTVSDYCHSRQFRVRLKADKSPPNVTEFLCSDSRVALLHPAPSVKSAGWIPSLRLNKPDWSYKPLSVPSLTRPKTWFIRSPEKGWKSTCPTEYFVLLPVLLISSAGARMHPGHVEFA